MMDNKEKKYCSSSEGITFPGTEITGQKRAEEAITRQNNILNANNRVYEMAIRCETIEALKEALITSEVKYHTLFTSMSEGFALCEIICDDQGIPVDYRFLEVNDAYKLQIGLSVADITGKTAKELFPQIHYAWIEIFGKVALSGEPVRFEKFNQNSTRYYEIYAYSPAKGQFAILFTNITGRKQMENALHENQALIKTIIENTPDYISLKDREGRYMVLNASAVDALRLTTGKIEDMIGRKDDDMFSPAEARGVMEADRQVITSGKSLVFDQSFVISGESRIFSTTKSPCFDKDGNIFGVVSISRDVTEQKQESMQKISRLAAIVENSEDAIMSMTNDGKISSWNRGATKLYGYSAEEVIGGPSSILVPDDALEQMNDVLINGGFGFEDNLEVHIRKDGTPIYVSVKSSVIRDVNGNILEISSIHRDITERIKYEKALTGEQELLKVTLNSLSEGVIAVDSENRIFLMNEAAVNLTGYSQREAIDVPLNRILNIIDDKTSEPVNIISQNPLQSKRRPILVTRTLKEVSLSLNCSPIKSIDGTAIIGSVIIFADVTEKQKTEQELFKAEKLESLGILAGGIAHDFNNLLAAILANVQLAQIKYNKNEDIGKYLNYMIESTHRASELTRQLLTFARGGAPVKKAASLTELIRDTAKFVLRGSMVKVECNISPNLWPVEVDIGQISQVIHNLVINAKQAMPKGGVIQIFAENITIESNCRFNPGNYLRIAVIDQGIGIPKENLPKIFDPFFTTKSEGSGLGLATSYSIIRQHDGFLEVESQVGTGTTFFIYLPAVSPASVVSNTGGEAAVTVERLKILLMDDEEAVLNSVGEMLQYCGHQVVMVANGVKAIEKYCDALEKGSPFDAVIMDLTIPGGMGGQEAIVHLRRADPKVKAIVSSGYANDPIIAEYERYGFCGVVTKPYKLDELNEVLNRVIESKQLPLIFDFK